MADRFDPEGARTAEGFWLVQRIERQPWAKQRAFYERPGVKVKSNPFGYGRLGDYEMAYMGSSEFEFGAIPAANNRFAHANELAFEHAVEIPGIARPLDFLWIAKEREPFEVFEKWFKDGMRSKERPYDFETQITDPKHLRNFEGKDEFRNTMGGDVWWALDANVQWSFAGETEEAGHLPQMLLSISSGEAPVEFLR